MRGFGACVGIALCTLSCAVAVSFDSYSERSQGRPLADASHAPLYAVSGTVQGLEADGGVNLTLNDLVDLTNVQNGPFAFPRSIAGGAPWRISASSNAATCVVHPAGGTAASDVAGVDVRCTSSDAALRELTLARKDTDSTHAGIFSPPFQADTVEYVVDVASPSTCQYVGKSSVYARPRHPGATVSVAGKLVDTSGQASVALLGTSVTRIEVNVTAVNALTSRRYVLMVAASGCPN